MKESVSNNLDQLKAVFAANPECNEVYQTSDNQVFTNNSSASVHQTAINRDYHTNHTFEGVKRDEVEGTKVLDNGPKKSAEERIADIGTAETIEALEELLKDEKAKTVLAAGEEKRAELLKGSE